jgi:crotonobetainyl-CoA:carnitine CoA-transferase CaiB-like acyl-CoA transferase
MDETPVLQGVRVIDLTTLLPGPFCTQMLADLGAEVIKVERREGGDGARTISPGAFAALNRGKRSLALDLRQEGDRARLLSLIPTADVFIEQFRPGVVDRLGVGYQTLATLNPRLIYCSLSGYGQHGPARDLPGHDINYLGVVGALDLPDGETGLPRHYAMIPMADMAGALFAANAILAALYRRATNPKVGGAYLDASLAGAALALMAGKLADAQRIGNNVRLGLAGGAYRAFLAQDGRALTIGCIEEPFWQRLCQALGHPEWLGEPRWATYALRTLDAAALDALLAEEFVRRSREEWLALLRAADLPVAPVNLPTEVERDPYVAATGLLLADDASEPPLRAVRYPVGMPGLVAPPGVNDHRRAPALGEYNAQLFGATEQAPSAEE